MVKRLNTTVDTDKIAAKIGYPLPLVDEVVNAIYEEQMSRKRQLLPPGPSGTISLREAERKFRVHHTTISNWIRMGCLTAKVIGNRTFVDEAILASIVTEYKKNAGKGVKTVRKLAKIANT